MRTTALLLAALLAQVAATPTEQTLYVPRDYPMQTSDDSEDHTQKVELTRVGNSVILTTYQPASSAPTEYHTNVEQVRIDVSGWQEVLPVLEEMINSERKDW